MKYIKHILILFAVILTQLTAVSQNSLPTEDKAFNSDTLFLNYLGQKNVYIDLPKIKGNLVNGKKEGEWFYYYTTDTLHNFLASIIYYEKGVPMHGKFFNYKQTRIASENFYKKGEIIKSIDYLNDSTPLVSANNFLSSKSYFIINDTTYYMEKNTPLSKHIILYNGKGAILTKVEKKPFKRIITDYHANGKIKGKGKLDKSYCIYGKWGLYDETGKKYAIKYLVKDAYWYYQDFFYLRKTNNFNTDLHDQPTSINN